MLIPRRFSITPMGHIIWFLANFPIFMNCLCMHVVYFNGQKNFFLKQLNIRIKARRDMSQRVYKDVSIFQQNGDFDVTVGKRDAKSLERDRGDVTVGTKNS